MLRAIIDLVAFVVVVTAAFSVLQPLPVWALVGIAWCAGATFGRAFNRVFRTKDNEVVSV